MTRLKKKKKRRAALFYAALQNKFTDLSNIPEIGDMSVHVEVRYSKLKEVVPEIESCLVAPYCVLLSSLFHIPIPNPTC